MMREALRFKRADLEGSHSELTFKRILATGAPPTHAVGDAAFEKLSAEARKVQDANPTISLKDIFRRLAQTNPNAMIVVFKGEIGEGAGYIEESEELAEDYYEMEGA